MPRLTLLVSLAAWALALVLAYAVAQGAANVIERRTARSLTQALAAESIGWVQIVPDGLSVTLSGTAPDESARIRALQVAGTVVDVSRLVDQLGVARRNTVVAPVFRVEILRRRDAVSVIGLVPEAEAGNPIAARLAQALPEARIEDMLQSADHAVPGGWVAAEAFALEAVQRFEVGRISVSAGRIEVEALVETADERRALEEGLRALAPRGQVLTLDLVAPRPVASPFLLRIEAGEGALRPGACVSDTEDGQARIAEALVAAGHAGRLVCPLALGAPSPRWGEAAAVAIAALAELGTGDLTMSDASVTLVAAHDVAQGTFDRAVGRLETALPAGFILTARRAPAPETGVVAQTSAPEVTMTLTPEGRLTLDGRLPDERIRAAVRGFAAARFGSGAVTLATRLDPALPTGWSVRVLTALEALAELHHGNARVLEGSVELSGVSGNPDAASMVSQALLDGLGAGASISVDVRYDETLDPVASAPTPDRCEARITGILAEDQIGFAPGSAEISEAGLAVVDRIAEVLRDCGELPFEVAGHTDSQGRAETNLNLSQARAEAVVNALLARRVLVASLVARGYGAENPIADNGTEAGRLANRRITFTLIRPEPEAVPLDPALEAQLVFEIRTPDDETIRPRPRPGSAAPSDLQPTVGSGDADQ